MKKRDMILVGCVLAAALVFWLVPKFFLDKGEEMLKISIDGKTFGVYPLDQKQEIEIGTTNVCRIEDKRVTMTAADCPDHLCLKQKSIDQSGGTIVCLPNRVVLEITGSAEDEVDSIAQ